jgi:hypothetical protein
MLESSGRFIGSHSVRNKYKSLHRIKCEKKTLDNTDPDTLSVSPECLPWNDKKFQKNEMDFWFNNKTYWNDFKESGNYQLYPLRDSYFPIQDGYLVTSP